ncbi:MAG: hypothetical protein M3R04_10915 [bacterium]|nr:hypothetical protein [bacterium]
MILRTTIAALALVCISCFTALAAEPPSIAVGEPHPQPGKPDPLMLRYLGINGNGAGRWSADGRQIAFTTSWTGTAQKWVIPSEGGFPRRLTYFEDAISFCDFSPHDPNLMWLGVSSGGNERTQLWFVNADGSGLRELAVNDAVIHNPGDWSRDGRYISYSSNERDESYFDIYVYDTQTGDRKLVFQRDANMSAGKFSPDGSWLTVSVNHSNVNNDMFLVETATGRSTLLTFHEEEANFGSYNWADKSTLYLVI